MKKIAIFAAAAALSMAVVSCNDNKTNTDATDAQNNETTEAVAANNEQAEAGKVVKLEDDNLLRPDKKLDKVTVIDFNNKYCVPCKKLTPAYDKAAEKYGNTVNFYNVDTEKCPETAKAFNVVTVPVVIIITADGKQQRFESLDAFISPEKLADKSVTADQVTDIIFESLNGYIEKAK